MYTIKKINLKDISKSTWDNIDYLLINNYPWDNNGYKPETKVQLFYTENDIRIRFTSCEKKVRIEIKDINGPVYQDSCVEFFFIPCKEHNESYFNIEMNAAGIYILQVGQINTDRKLIYDLPKSVLDIKTDIDENNYMKFNNFKPWHVEYKIPFDLIREYVQEFRAESGHTIYANFYKCGSKTEFNHYGCWQHITYHKPSFHRLESFGKLTFE